MKDSSVVGHNTDGFLSLDDVANMLRVSPRTIRRLVADGLLPIYRFSSKLVRFRAEEVMAAFAKVRVPGKGEA